MNNERSTSIELKLTKILLPQADALPLSSLVPSSRNWVIPNNEQTSTGLNAMRRSSTAMETVSTKAYSKKNDNRI